MQDFGRFFVTNIAAGKNRCCRCDCPHGVHAAQLLQPRQLQRLYIHWLLRLVTATSSAMENASLPSDVWHDVTTSPSQSDDLTLYLANIRDLALKVIYIIIGTVGVLNNLFVLIIFILFIKITDKVLRNRRICKCVCTMLRNS